MLSRLFFVRHGAQLDTVSSEVSKLKEKKMLFQKRFYQENVEATFLMLSHCHRGLTINHRVKSVSESADARSGSASFVFLKVMSLGILLK